MGYDYFSEYCTQKNRANRLEAELKKANSQLSEFKAREEERSAAEKQKEAEKQEPANIIRRMLVSSNIGIESLKALEKMRYSVEFDALGDIASSICPEDKKIVLNSAYSPESGALSVVHASRILKQEREGADKTPETMAVRKADALLAQMLFADEMYQKNPKILETFIARGNGPMYDAYKNAQRAAYSSCVNLYLDNVMPDKKPAPEKIASVCKDADGQSYYVDAKGEPVRPSMSVNVYNETTFNMAFATKAKQGGR